MNRYTNYNYSIKILKKLEKKQLTVCTLNIWTGKQDKNKQRRPRSDAAERDVRSGSTLTAALPAVSRHIAGSKYTVWLRCPNI